MAYRTECRKTVKEFFHIMKNFLTNPVSMDEPDYSQATGNGNIENINFNYDNAQTEEWTLQYDAANNKFTVTGSISGAQADAYIDTPYDNGIISFTIRQGDKAWQNGDIVTIKCYKSTNPPFKLINSGWYRSKMDTVTLQGVKGFSLSSDSYYYNFYNGRTNETNYTLYGSQSYYCGAIDTSHKLNQKDCTIHFSCIPTPTYHTQAIWLHNFTSDSITSETTKYISIDFNRKKVIYSRSFDKPVSSYNSKNNFPSIGYTGYYYHANDTYTVYSWDSSNSQYVVYEDYIDISSFIDNLSNRGQIAHFDIIIDNATGKLTIYGNGSEIGSDTYGELVNASYRIYQIRMHNTTSFYYWSRKLSLTEMQGIIDNNGFPSKNNANDYYASFFTDENFLPYFIISPANKFGFFMIDGQKIKYQPVISAKWLPYSLSEQDLTQTSISYRYEDGYFHFDIQYIDFGGLNEVLDKYWIVHNGESILIVTKHYDTSKNPNPVYQMYYIGWNKGNTTYDLPVVIGMKNSSFNWFETSDSNYRFGLMYSKNTSVWLGGYQKYSSAATTGWYSDYIDQPQMSSDWNNIKTTDNFTTIMYINHYRSISYGTPNWLYVINTDNLTPESEVYINGTKYIVIPDNFDSGANYYYLIELQKD